MTGLKALVDKEKNRVIFAESDGDFIDVLFSFLTLPMGTIIRRTSDKLPTMGIGCMTNLYESIKNLDMQLFRTEACKTMLLYPRNCAAAHCKRLRLPIDDDEPLRYFLCSTECTLFKYKLLSLYPNAICECGMSMDLEMKLSVSDKPTNCHCMRGVFVKGPKQFIITDELQVKPSSKEESFSLLSKLGLMDSSTIEECNIDVGVDEVLTLLKCSLVSNTTLTETLLKHHSVPEFRKEDFDEGGRMKPGMEQLVDIGWLRGNLIFIRSLVSPLIGLSFSIGHLKPQQVILEPDLSSQCDKSTVSDEENRCWLSTIGWTPGASTKPMANANGKIHVKLMVSKSKKIVCYAEASEDFVNLLSSFLTIPLGYIVKKMHSSISKGSVNHLYNSVLELDTEKFLKSDEHKAMLVSPKLAPDFSFKDHPLDIEEDLHPPYCISQSPYSGCTLTSDATIYYRSNVRSSILTIRDPKSRFKETTRGGGFVRGPAIFTVTDNLIITPISQVSNLSLLIKLKVPFSDIEEHVVQVGSEEAMRLLLASFVTESALTNALLRQPNQE